MANKKLRICFVSDFFYPQFGGVETHIFCLSQQLIKMGHKVIVITGNIFKHRQGVRYMANGLKVYYLPMKRFYEHRIVGLVAVSGLPYFRDIVLREKIEIVHTHQINSMLGMECILHAKLMGLTVLLTSHSLYSPGALSVICSSYLYNSIYTHLDHIICVSKTCKENFVVNSIFDHTKISVIPNGIDSTRFKPDPSKRPNPKKKINVICIGRFYKRKGIELITGVIPLICAKYKNAHFIIVGDGPKKILVEEMRKKNQLNDRITIKPGIPFDKVRENLIEAHIFLNGSLTESFCMANLEAMSCGLHVVTTNVGGIPEVNPDDQFTMCSPNISSMESALSGVIDNFSVDEEKLHRIVGNRFNWQNVAERTLKTYVCAKSSTTAPFLERIKKIKELGVSSYFFILILIVEIMLLNFLEWVDPEEGFEIAIDYPQNK